jgi:hypothetical protein
MARAASRCRAGRPRPGWPRREQRHLSDHRPDRDRGHLPVAERALLSPVNLADLLVRAQSSAAGDEWCSRSARRHRPVIGFVSVIGRVTPQNCLSSRLALRRRSSPPCWSPAIGACRAPRRPAPAALVRGDLVNLLACNGLGSGSSARGCPSLTTSSATWLTRPHRPRAGCSRWPSSRVRTSPSAVTRTGARPAPVPARVTAARSPAGQPDRRQVGAAAAGNLAIVAVRHQPRRAQPGARGAVGGVRRPWSALTGSASADEHTGGKARTAERGRE